MLRSTLGSNSFFTACLEPWLTGPARPPGWEGPQSRTLHLLVPGCPLSLSQLILRAVATEGQWHLLRWPRVLIPLVPGSRRGSLGTSCLWVVAPGANPGHMQVLLMTWSNYGEGTPLHSAPPGPRVPRPLTSTRSRPLQRGAGVLVTALRRGGAVRAVFSTVHMWLQLSFCVSMLHPELLLFSPHFILILLFKYSFLPLPCTSPPHSSHPRLPPDSGPPWFCPCVLYSSS